MFDVFAAVYITVGVFHGLVAAILVLLAASEMCLLPHNRESNSFSNNLHDVITIRTQRQFFFSFSYYMLLKHFTHRLNSTTKWPLLCVQAGSLICIKTLLLRTTRRRCRESSDLKNVAFRSAVGRKATL